MNSLLPIFFSHFYSLSLKGKWDSDWKWKKFDQNNIFQLRKMNELIGLNSANRCIHAVDFRPFCKIKLDNYLFNFRLDK